MRDLIDGMVITAISIRIAIWMIQNIKNGKSFCGFTIDELLDMTENKKQG